jgi:hypothetical protein
MAPREWLMRTRLSPEICAERLEGRIDSDISWLASWFGTKPVQGHVRRGWASLHKRPALRNEFQPILAVSITPAEGGARLFCRVGRFWTYWVMVVAWGFLVAFVAVGAVLNDALFGVGELIFLLALGLASAAFGRWLGRNDLAFLLAFVQETLEADVVEEAG